MVELGNVANAHDVYSEKQSSDVMYRMCTLWWTGLTPCECSSFGESLPCYARDQALYTLGATRNNAMEALR
jgi:hypothetical protein